MSMYPFSKPEHAKYAERIGRIVQIQWVQNESICSNAEMEFRDDIRSVEIRYKYAADEVVDIVHELLHVEMFFLGGFQLLAWDQRSSPREINRFVGHIRNIADDTYVYSVLADRFDVFPLSPVFFSECKRDTKRGWINLASNERDGTCRLAVAAWRIRMAELATQDFADKLAPDEMKIAKQFLAAFENPPAEIADFLSVIHRSVKTDQVSNVVGHSQALVALRNHFGLPDSVLHLAAFRKEPAGYALVRI